MSQKGLAPILIVLILAALVGGYLVYQLQPKSLPSQQITQSTTSPPKSKLDMPDDWTIINNQTCNVEIPIPPNKPPYIVNDTSPSRVTNDTGRYWQFEEYSSGMFIFDHTARAIFKHPDEGSGYVSGDIEIICSPNTEKYTTDILITKLEADLPEEITVKNRIEGNMWNRKVFIYKFQGGMFNDEDYYVFATNKNIYLIRKIVGSQIKSVRETADEIFNNLQFIN